ncbi:MAG: hypothetical protein LBS43_02225, partial [Prevotellaceae bacterium]|jgi:hypothetical protein|nr:hypothetical protein [Prevotellaceae bacterium]
LLAQNRLTGDIPVALLEHPYWDAWKSGICPQQSGYGFGNCSSGAQGGIQGTASKTKTLSAGDSYKARYRNLRL